MTNDKSNQERAKEYDQIIAMQKILLQTIFRNGVSIGGKPVTLDLNESQRVSLNRVGVKVEKRQRAPKFKVNDKVVIVDHHEPLACREYWIVSGVHVGVIASSYRLVSEQGDILDCINEHQLEIYKVAAPKFGMGEKVNVQESEGPFTVLDGRCNGSSYDYQLRNVAGVSVDWTSETYLRPYVAPAPVPFLSDDTFKQGDVVKIAKPRDHSEATGKPWIVTGKFSNNTATISRFGDGSWLPANDKTVPMEILAKFPEAKYGPGQKVVFLDSNGDSIDGVVKNNRLIDEGYYLYELAPLGNYNFGYTSVPEKNITGTYKPPASPRFKPGDLVTTPDGRDWIIDKIEMTEPETRDFHYWLRQVADREYRNTARDYELTLTPEAQSAPAILGAFYDAEEPALFDPELVMTRSQRDELMDCLYWSEAKGWEPEIILRRIRKLFPQPE